GNEPAAIGTRGSRLRARVFSTRPRRDAVPLTRAGRKNAAGDDPRSLALQLPQMTTPWLYRQPAAPPGSARMRLVCFPYAGAGPSVFRTWGSRLPTGVELVALRLPGRESRFTETPYTDWPTL